MKSATLIAVFFALHSFGCVAKPPIEPSTPGAITGSVQTPERAIKIVQRHIRSRGGDPLREEITAKWHKGTWAVTAWHIVYPENKGSSRFVPCGFTFYTVSSNGRVSTVMP